ncbi:MAG: tRNA (adenosine(37)-N6)-threonylcarbamoyltransferase complex transferase subunit TsaD [Bacteroidales bacterium]|nr:tRNA (adenosine(37)-N6)-threonylcarbamoyltransferase complex transferase subunit TsaD [Bacteroidales bacterium]
MAVKILGIESSCDDTSAAVVCDGKLLSNVINTQAIHEKYGGVVPELASRAHQQNIVLVVKEALTRAEVKMSEIDAIAFTKGPGLLGSLLVGASFAKGLSVAQDIPLVGVNHLHGHILAHFLREKDEDECVPKFPFLCLLVSGGHSQIVLVRDYLDFEIIGKTIDDAAGEAFDKCAKVMGLPYPGGPVIDKLSKLGDENRFKFAKPSIPGFDYSFSGLKTSFLYTVRDEVAKDSDFIANNVNDLAASLQKTIIDILFNKLEKAVKQTGIRRVAISGGVSANSGLRNRMLMAAEKKKWEVYIPKISYTTDNAAMIALVGYYMYLKGKKSPLSVVPQARINFMDL